MPLRQTFSRAEKHHACSVGQQMFHRAPPPNLSALLLSYLWYSYPLMCTVGGLEGLNYGKAEEEEQLWGVGGQSIQLFLPSGYKNGAA